MTTVTVSPQYQVVIPQEEREALGIRPGQKIQVLAYEGRRNERILPISVAGIVSLATDPGGGVT